MLKATQRLCGKVTAFGVSIKALLEQRHGRQESLARGAAFTPHDTLHGN